MDVVYAVSVIVGAVFFLGMFVLPFWALRRHNRMYPVGRDRISRDPEAAQATRRFETMWAYLSGRGGS